MDETTMQYLIFFIIGLIVFLVKTIIGAIKKRRNKGRQNEETKT
jgi:hypothetical protein